MLRRLSIGRRLGLALGLVLLLLAVAAATGYWGIRSVFALQSEILDVEVQVAQRSAAAAVHTARLRRYERDFLLGLAVPVRREAAAAGWQAQRARLERDLGELDHLVVVPSDAQALAGMREDLAAYAKGFEALLDLVAAETIRTTEEGAAALFEHQPEIDRLETAATLLAEDAERRQSEHQQEVPGIRRRAETIILGVGLLALIVSAALAALLTRSFTRPIAAAVAVAERVSRGELPDRLPAGGADEITRLVEACNAMTAYLRETAATAAAIAHGDLGARVAPRSDQDVLGHAFNGMGDYLKAMAGAAEAISHGDLRTSVTPKSDRDVLGWAFAEMTTYLRAIARTADAVAKGDLREAVRAKSERDALGRAFGNMVEGLRGLVGEVRGGSSEVAAAAGGIAAASEEGAKGAEGAQAAIEEMTSTMLELSANVQQVAQNAQGQAATAAETASAIARMVASARRISERSEQLADLARRSGEAVAGGQAAVRRSADAVAGGMRSVERSATGMARISSAIGGSAEAIEGLGRRAQEIGRIVGIIDDIATRTNLLALNAAIIAAQAGEQGRSFAVVAQEVRTLAERSAQSTREIGGLIAAIQEETLAAIAHMQASRDSVTEGLALGAEVKDALGRIDAAAADVTIALAGIETTVAEVGRYTADIGQATREQATGGAQVEGEMTRLADMAQEIQRATREQASGASEVVKLAERMRGTTQTHAAAAAAMRESAGILDTNADRLTAAVARFRTLEGEGP